MLGVSIQQIAAAGTSLSLAAAVMFHSHIGFIHRIVEECMLFNAAFLIFFLHTGGKIYKYA